MGDEAVELVGEDIQAIAKRAVTDYQLVGDDGDIPLAQEFRRQTATAVHDDGYVVSLNQWVTT